MKRGPIAKRVLQRRRDPDSGGLDDLLRRQRHCRDKTLWRARALAVSDHADDREFVAKR